MNKLHELDQNRKGFSVKFTYFFLHATQRRWKDTRTLPPVAGVGGVTGLAYAQGPLLTC